MGRKPSFLDFSINSPNINVQATNELKDTTRPKVYLNLKSKSSQVEDITT
jgi:hypothetical protein